MSQTGPWSVKGIDQRARDAAREAAMAEGLTLGEYLNRLLMASDSPEPNEVAEPFRGARPKPDAASSALDRLARRIEATEARSTLAITGMDHTILGLVARLENSEQTSSVIAGHVEGLIDQMRETHEALQAKVRRLEQDNSSKQNLEALKALENALGKLASYVYEENELAQNETQAIKGRVEAGLSDISDRVESMETKVETTLSAAAQRVEKAVEQAELRAEGTARHLSERMSTLESNVHKRLASVDKADERLDAVEADVSGALDSMEGTLLRIQDRLNRAETTTDAALKSLESTYASLDHRIEQVANQIDPDLAQRLRTEFEARFEDLTRSVRETVDSARLELADEITRAASGQDGAVVTELKASLGDVQKRMSVSEERQARALETVSSQVNRLNTNVDARLREVETRLEDTNGDSIREEIERFGDSVSERIETISSELQERVSDSERRSASAIEQIGDQVAAATSRLQMRQNEAMKSLAEQLLEDRKKTDVRLSEALATVSERLDQVQKQSTSFLSPVQKAMASLASRLESLEDFTTPPFAGRPHASSSPVDGLVEADPVLPQSEEFEPFEEFPIPPASMNSPVVEDDAAFEEGVESWQVHDAPLAQGKSPYSDDFDSIRAAVEELSAAGSAVPEQEFLADLPNDLDDNTFAHSLDAFGEPDDDRTEARESDIFDSSGFDENSFEDAFDDAPEPKPESHFHAYAQDDTADYIARARRAAIAASSVRPAPGASRVRAAPLPRTSHGSTSKLPLIAAASAVVITGSAVGGYLYLRGKQAPPVPRASVSTYVDPLATSAMPETPAATPSADDSLFDSLPADELAANPADDLFDAETPTADATPTAEPRIETLASAIPVVATPAASVTEPAPKPKFQAPAPVPATAPLETATEVTPDYPPVPPVVTADAAAASGNAVAQFQLAQEKLTGSDFQSGADLMRRAAQKDLAMAQYALGKLHEKGTGVPKDLALAREWTEKAANAGNVKAMHDLAVFQAEGDGGPQTYAGAVEWFRKAAEYGVVDSQYNLGVLYEQGLGISPNLTEALFWFYVAAKNGDGGAPEKVSELVKRVSPEAAAQAQSRADAWQPAHANAIANGRFGAQPWNLGNPLQVQGVQVALTALGYDAGGADGVMGSATAQAIRDYQKANQLPVTGTVTAELIERLNAGATPGRT